MSLTPEQTAEVATWVRDGATLSDVQKRIDTDFKIAMTYMDVRFLVDDLDLTLIDQAPKADANDVTKSPPPKPPPPATDAAAPAPGAEDAPTDADAPAIGGVTLEVDHAVLIPGAIASGSVTFSDGVTGKWMVDHQGRPGFTEVSQEDYRPSPEDGEAFMQELSAALRAKGMG
ncbi:MAG: hypothetical protein HOH58_05860 [Opitutaceae bacterium]|jgi:hypothetical protein|nr:hypothetical protein [Opitutaceae bacterium]